MSPLPTSTLKNVPSVPLNESVVVKIDLSSPSNVVLESALTNTVHSLPLPILITLLALVGLYIFTPRIFNWRYPVQSTETLRKMVDSMEWSVRDNSRIVNGRNVLKESRGEVKAKLKPYRAWVTALENRTEPPRLKLVMWVIFRLKMVRDIDDCYLGLVKLQVEIKDKLESVQDEHYTTSAIQTNLVCVVARNRTSTMSARVEM